jgi:hypothetical protein
MAAQKNFKVDQNATFSFEVEYLDENDVAIQLQNYTAKMQVRNVAGDKLAFTLTHADGLTINPTQGKINVSISPDRTNKMFYPKSSYDLVITDSSQNKYRLLEGFMTLNRAVTI